MIDLKFDKVSKRYSVRQEVVEDLTRHPIMRKIKSLRRPAEDFWALRDVSFEIERGESLGIIGHNGAGKSTILKLLANITSPTSGEITINGRLSALIEVGSGFHPELSGRENIYLNGSILGMRQREITEKLDSIVDFAGVRPFLDTPVKRFSSGMYVRLGFSIAAHLDPDILLLDEVLAVGDAAFQAKCLQRIDDLKRSGTTIVFISHDLGAVERVCDRVVLMQQGQIRLVGTPTEAINFYQTVSDFTAGRSASHSLEGSNSAEITGLAFYDSTGSPCAVSRTGELIEARVAFTVYKPIEDVILDVLFYSADGSVHCEFTTSVSGPNITVNAGIWAIDFVCPELGLLPGVYYTDVAIKHRGGIEAINVHIGSTVLRVEKGKMPRGNFYLPHTWSLVQVN